MIGMENLVFYSAFDAGTRTSYTEHDHFSNDRQQWLQIMVSLFLHPLQTTTCQATRVSESHRSTDTTPNST